MNYQILFVENAENDLAVLDSKVARRILEKLEWFRETPNPLRFAERLTKSPYGEYRFRVGDYRILFDLNARGVITILVILRIKHRREAY